MRRSVLLLSLTLAAAGATAQEHPWTARFPAGGSTIHEWGEGGVWGEARIGRSFVGGVLSADLGLAVSSSDEGYGSLTAGLEVLPFPGPSFHHSRAPRWECWGSRSTQATWPPSEAACRYA